MIVQAHLAKNQLVLPTTHFHIDYSKVSSRHYQLAPRKYARHDRFSTITTSFSTCAIQVRRGHTINSAIRIRYLNFSRDSTFRTADSACDKVNFLAKGFSWQRVTNNAAQKCTELQSIRQPVSPRKNLLHDLLFDLLLDKHIPYE